jgi:UDP-N-acetylmuramate dehydrogenase
MKINLEKNVLLSKHNTLKVGGVADYFVTVESKEELIEALQFAKQTATPLFVFGGGSNILVNDAGYRGLVIKNKIAKRSYFVHGENVYVACGSGEVFDEVVTDSVAKNYWGLENLSAIPGSVGATPIQNVGAYGVEVSSIITEVSAVHIDTLEIKNFSNAECKFSYRDSFFKTEAGRKWIIIEVVFKLSLLKNPQLSYGSLSTLDKNSISTSSDVRNEIVKIRSTKFPNWREVGTAGSFFKNPIIKNLDYEALAAKYTDLPGYFVSDQTTKVSLGWILDKICGLKGYSKNGVSLYKEQALVLVNESANSANAIDDFANYVAEVVKEKTGIIIEREVTSV